MCSLPNPDRRPRASSSDERRRDRDMLKPDADLERQRAVVDAFFAAFASLQKSAGVATLNRTRLAARGVRLQPPLTLSWAASPRQPECSHQLAPRFQGEPGPASEIVPRRSLLGQWADGTRQRESSSWDHRVVYAQ